MMIDRYSKSTLPLLIDMINNAGVVGSLVSVIPEVDTKMNIQFTALLRFDYDTYVEFRQRTGRTYTTLEGFRKGIL